MKKKLRKHIARERNQELIKKAKRRVAIPERIFNVFKTVVF